MSNDFFEQQDDEQVTTRTKVIIGAACALALVLVLAVALIVVTRMRAGLDEKEKKMALAQKLEQEGKYDDAIDAYHDVIMADAEYPDAYSGLARAYANSGDLDKAKAILEACEVYYADPDAVAEKVSAIMTGGKKEPSDDDEVPLDDDYKSGDERLDNKKGYDEMDEPDTDDDLDDILAQIEQMEQDMKDHEQTQTASVDDEISSDVTEEPEDSEVSEVPESSVADEVSETSEVSEVPESSVASEIEESSAVSEVPEPSEVSEVPESSVTEEPSEAPEAEKPAAVSETPEASETPEVSEASESAVVSETEGASESSVVSEIEEAAEAPEEVLNKYYDEVLSKDAEKAGADYYFYYTYENEEDYFGTPDHMDGKTGLLGQTLLDVDADGAPEMLVLSDSVKDDVITAHLSIYDAAEDGVSMICEMDLPVSAGPMDHTIQLAAEEKEDGCYLYVTDYFTCDRHEGLGAHPYAYVYKYEEGSLKEVANGGLKEGQSEAEEDVLAFMKESMPKLYEAWISYVGDDQAYLNAGWIYEAEADPSECPFVQNLSDTDSQIKTLAIFRNMVVREEYQSGDPRDWGGCVEFLP